MRRWIWAAFHDTDILAKTSRGSSPGGRCRGMWPYLGNPASVCSLFYLLCLSPTACRRAPNQLPVYKQEAFEKCWAHSPLRAAALPFTRCRYCRTPPAHRCPQRLRRRQQRQRQRVTEGTAMAPYGPNETRILPLRFCSVCFCSCRL